MDPHEPRTQDRQFINIYATYDIFRQVTTYNRIQTFSIPQKFNGFDTAIDIIVHCTTYVHISNIQVERILFIIFAQKNESINFSTGFVLEVTKYQNIFQNIRY